MQAEKSPQNNQTTTDRLICERDDALRDRDEWKASSEQYHKINAWLDAERAKYIAALRELSPNHPMLPENIK